MKSCLHPPLFLIHDLPSIVINVQNIYGKILLYISVPLFVRLILSAYSYSNSRQFRRMGIVVFTMLRPSHSPGQQCSFESRHSRNPPVIGSVIVLPTVENNADKAQPQPQPCRSSAYEIAKPFFHFHFAENS